MKLFTSKTRKEERFELKIENVLSLDELAQVRGGSEGGSGTGVIKE